MRIFRQSGADCSDDLLQHRKYAPFCVGCTLRTDECYRQGRRKNPRRKNLRPEPHLGINQAPEYLEQFYPYQCQKDALAIWEDRPEKMDMSLMPPITYTEEENEEVAEIETEITTVQSLFPQVAITLKVVSASVIE